MISEAAALGDDDGDDGGSETRPQSAPSGSSDPFLNNYDLSKVKVDDKTADRLLGLLVVVSNLFS